LSDKIAAGEVAVLEALNLSEPKTRLVAELVRRLDAENGALIVVDRVEPSLARAARNLPRVQVRAAASVSTYEVLRWPHLIATREGMNGLERRLRVAAGRKA
jgi:large subunit ribosomal protein L4